MVCVFMNYCACPRTLLPRDTADVANAMGFATLCIIQFIPNVACMRMFRDSRFLACACKRSIKQCSITFHALTADFFFWKGSGMPKCNAGIAYGVLTNDDLHQEGKACLLHVSLHVKPTSCTCPSTCFIYCVSCISFLVQPCAPCAVASISGHWPS